MADADIEMKFDTERFQVDIMEIKKTQVKNIFYFRPMGAINSRDPESIDAIDEMSHFNKSELFLLKIVSEKVSSRNRIIITKSRYTKNEQVKLSAGIKSWMGKGLMKRIKREHYIVSPYFFTPAKEQHQVVSDAWKYLEAKGK